MLLWSSRRFLQRRWLSQRIDCSTEQTGSSIPTHGDAARGVTGVSLGDWFSKIPMCSTRLVIVSSSCRCHACANSFSHDNRALVSSCGGSEAGGRGVEEVRFLGLSVATLVAKVTADEATNMMPLSREPEK